MNKENRDYVLNLPNAQHTSVTVKTAMTVYSVDETVGEYFVL